MPRFGNWNVSDDSSKEGFTVVFDRARNEKMSGERTALGNISPLNFPKKDLHVSSKGSKIFKKKALRNEHRTRQMTELRISI